MAASDATSATPVKPAYSPGLEGVIAGESAICSLDSEAGLRYRGYAIFDLAKNAIYAEIIYLLMHGELPNAEQFAELRHQIVLSRELPEEVTQMLRLLPKETHPMDALRTGVSMLAGFDAELNDNSHSANIRKAVRIISRMGNLTCSYQRISEGKEPIAPRQDLTASGNFLWMLKGEEPEDWRIKAMDVIFALYAEHDYNASTFAARTTVSTLADIYAGITSAIGALKGPLHGGANEEAMKMFSAIGSPQYAEPWLMDRLAQKEKIMGFGHRVYKHGDSRSKVLHELCADLGKRLDQPQWIEIGEILERIMEKEKGLFSNADFYAAPVFHMLEIPSELNTPIFACSRSAGWCAHIIEQHDHNRLIRPRSLFIGSAPRAFKAMKDR